MPKEQQFNFDVEVGKILNLMINSLYTNKDVALRELISNASDACDKLRYLAAQNPDLLQDELKISITTDKAKKLLIIADNGIGMNREDLIQNLGTIARSGTENFLKSLTGDGKKDVQLIGQFGVGFYSAFMAGKTVRVQSRSWDKSEGHEWLSDGTGSFTITEMGGLRRGTKVIIELKDDANSTVEQTARVIAQVKYQAAQIAILVQVGQMLAQFGNRIVLELGYTNPAVAGLGEF